MTNKILFSIIFTLIGLVVLFTTISMTQNTQLNMSRNHKTIYEWLSCMKSYTKKQQSQQQQFKQQCDDTINDQEKQLCLTTSHAVRSLTDDESKEQINSCQLFNEYLRNANINDELNQYNLYQDCYLNSTILKQAYQSSYYNQSIYYPLYIDCAGF